MLLTGIVFLAATMSLSSINRVVFSRVSEKHEKEAVLLFLMRLREDIVSSEYLTEEQSSLIVHIASDSIKRSYSFLSSKVEIVQGESTDTIKLKIRNLNLKSNIPGLVEEISFDFILGEAMHHFYYKKEYAADFLFNNCILEDRKWE
jgi:hypothetical protein